MSRTVASGSLCIFLSVTTVGVWFKKLVKKSRSEFGDRLRLRLRLGAELTLLKCP